MDTTKDTKMQHVTDVTTVPEATAEFIAGLLERIERLESDLATAEQDSRQKQARIERLEHAPELLDELMSIIDRAVTELNAVAKERDAMRAMLRAALDVLEDVKGNINPERGYADELEADVERAIAATVIPGAKGE